MNLLLSIPGVSDLLQMHRNARTVREHFFPLIIPQLLHRTWWRIYRAVYLMPTVANLTPYNFLLVKEKLSDSKQEQLFLA